MLTHMLHAYDLQLNNAKRQVGDIPDALMCTQPAGLVNHPTWSLGHLIMSAHGVGELIGIEPDAPEGWAELFKTGGTPSSDPTGQPTKAELLAEQDTPPRREFVELVREAHKYIAPTNASFAAWIAPPAPPIHDANE